MSGVLETPYIPPLDSYVLPKDSLLFVKKKFSKMPRSTFTFEPC